ncbi:aromatic ring-hydroxylating dioxygenase subunit alpha [Burkholderia sp. Ac-20384]|uniref:Rieske (2Fe-2S) protein n=1 Tax=Burkholderia lata (strain ATCC 17760 / DSM 23089 / LMG 22485 / NCIMB 9086 / R18194 / 383) TaxID=482957 RepID=Q399G0_BURL3|nr:MULTISPECIES: aromatic ring-hydroxylating dioxygenase subunit alpha [Burkholderia]ABB10901.1 Rieske (2Fe-2S) protein [Burkholderia lata]AKM41518.1 Rieske (2Fe-2S) protein [Burkholderia contaminans]MBN3828047.1 aromatic ring-hydroxylating dioxygenase subunit alpha [Burkholderia sp. Ac-20384]VWC37543.1 (2Fe-2S)-binding protein [Burkholderia lata]
MTHTQVVPLTRSRAPVPPRHCTFDVRDWEILSRYWHPVAFATEVGDRPLAVTLLDERIVLFRSGGAIVAARDVCPHRGAPLSRGWVVEDRLVCPYHGLEYAADGKCVRIPSQPDGPIPERLCLTTYAAQQAYGLVWVSLGGGELPLPDFPAWNAEGFQQILPPSIDIRASAGRQTEGFIDVAHFAWIHHESFADRRNPVVPQYSVERRENGLHAEYVSTVSNFPKSMQHRAPEGFLWRRVFEVDVPFFARLTVHFPEGGRLAILNAASPVSARLTRLFVPIARNFDHDLPLDDVYEFNRQVFEEDREIVEQQCPEDLPIDRSHEAPILADRSSGAYRRALGEIGLGQSYAR